MLRLSLWWLGMDEGPPSSYLLLAKDTPVFGSDGGVVGKVEEVLCDPGEDIFDGLVLATGHGDRFLAAELVTSIHERGVDISIPSAQASELPLPAFCGGECCRPIRSDRDNRSARGVGREELETPG